MAAEHLCLSWVQEGWRETIGYILEADWLLYTDVRTVGKYVKISRPNDFIWWSWNGCQQVWNYCKIKCIPTLTYRTPTLPTLRYDSHKLAHRTHCIPNETLITNTLKWSALDSDSKLTGHRAYIYFLSPPSPTDARQKNECTPPTKSKTKKRCTLPRSQAGCDSIADFFIHFLLLYHFDVRPWTLTRQNRKKLDAIHSHARDFVFGCCYVTYTSKLHILDASHSLTLS